MVCEAAIDGAEGHADEEDRRDAELEAPDIDVPDEVPQPDDRKKEEDGIGGKEVEKGGSAEIEAHDHEMKLRHTIHPRGGMSPCKSYPLVSDRYFILFGISAAAPSRSRLFFS
mgnify:CR=1 FL=1